MVEGAATFSNLVGEWLGTTEGLVTSMPFNYAVHRDSLLPASEVERHLQLTYQRLTRRILAREYLGLDIGDPPIALTDSQLEHDYNPDTVVAVFRTSEVAIDPDALARSVRGHVAAHDAIRTVFDTEVREVTVGDEAVNVGFTGQDGEGRADYDHVVNALWEGRLAVDKTAGIVPAHPWLHRVKHFLRVEAMAWDLPSTTIVLGPFGDIVNYGGGAFYLSWYPSGLQGSSGDLEIPEWLRHLPDEAAPVIRKGILEGLSTIVPALATPDAGDEAVMELLGGAIFAWGESDIDDIRSELHRRFAIGPASHGRYHTIDTGKLTMAPMFARQVADRILATR
jgi:hypothetical protein